ncbi:MAG: cytochrome P450 [Caulobacteraceae bacterium]
MIEEQALATVPPPLRTGLLRSLSAKTWVEAVPEAAYRTGLWRFPGPVPFLVVNDPAAIKHILLDNMENWPKADLQLRFASMILGEGLLLSEGPVWRAHRKLMAPAFDPRSVAALAPMMAAAAATASAGWREGPIDLMTELSRLTLRIISSAMFSDASDELAALVAEAVPEALALRPSLLDLTPGLGAFSLAAREKQSARIFARLNDAVFRLIDARRAAGEAAPDDLLTRLVQSRDETGAGLTDAEIRDQAVTVYVAGHETTSVALNWTFYVLSQRPEIAAGLAAEWADVLGERPVTAADAPRLVYTRAVIEETMRLYPPAALLGRQAVAADSLAGMPVKAGQLAMISPWVLHRNPDLWPEPERFDPARFLLGAPARPRFAYLPFGAGPHICIGAQLAMTEAVVVLATLARQWRFQVEPDQTIALRHRATLRPADPIGFRAVRR